MDKYFAYLAMRLARVVMLLIAYSAMVIEILCLKMLQHVGVLLWEA
jgi:hypothetical protein